MYLAPYLFYMNNLSKSILSFISIIVLLYSCSGSDDDDISSIPLEPLGDQYVIENDSIIE